MKMIEKLLQSQPISIVDGIIVDKNGNNITDKQFGAYLCGILNSIKPEVRELTDVERGLLGKYFVRNFDIFQIKEAKVINGSCQFECKNYTTNETIMVSLSSALASVEENSSYICFKMCNECPFSKNSLRGFLSDYITDDFKEMKNNDIAFVCHMSQDDEISLLAVNKKILSKQVKVCRGYIESYIKDYRSPKTNDLMKLLVQEVRKQTLSTESMSNQEFIAHHGK
jgi:hypothetical protein